MTRFAAIDFETANHSQDSACAVGVVIVESMDTSWRACMSAYARHRGSLPLPIFMA